VYHFEYNRDNSGWVAITTPAAVLNPTVNLPGPGTYQFRVYITAAGYTPSAFTTAPGNVVIAAPATAPAYLVIQSFNAQKASVYLISAPSSTPGAVYNFEYNKDNAGWVAIGTPGAVSNPTFTLPAPGTYQFRVYITAAGFTPSAATATVSTATVSNVLATPAYLNIQARYPSTGKVYLISAPSVSSTPGLKYVFEYSADNGATWTALAPNAARNPTIQMPGSGNYTFQVKVTDTNGIYTDSGYATAVGNFTY
jgi:hypothetical protein